METKQVIIRNRAEETKCLKECDKRSYIWRDGVKPSKMRPSDQIDLKFPYCIFITDGIIAWYLYSPQISVTQFLESVDN